MGLYRQRLAVKHLRSEDLNQKCSNFGNH